MKAFIELTNTIRVATDVDLHALRFALSRCGIACKEFKDEIGKPCLTRMMDVSALEFGRRYAIWGAVSKFSGTYFLEVSFRCHS